jgi:hypothetical protein
MHTYTRSCSDNGTVVVSIVGLGADDKDIVVPFNQSMKAVCIENNSSAKKEKSFLVGGANGQLIYHRTVWYVRYILPCTRSKVYHYHSIIFSIVFSSSQQ